MVRENRIKEYRFSETISATTTGSYVGSHSINGEILEVNYSYGSQGGTGSIFLTFGETGETFMKDLTASGAGVQVTRPYAYINDNVGGVAVGSITTPYVANDRLVLNVGSVLSGATALSVNVLYR
jgi:hypothetical protein